MTTAAGGLKQRSLHDFFAKSVRTPDSISKRLELVDETDSDIEAAVANLDNNDDEMNVTYDDADDDAQTDFTLPKRISFSPSQCSEPDGEPSCDPDVASSQKQHPWSDDFAPPSFSQMYSQQSFCDFSTPQDQPVRALREVHALVALSDSRHIVRYYDAWIENELLYIQLEFMHGCSLATFLGDATHVSEATVRKVLKHLATIRGEGLPSSGDDWQKIRNGELTVFRHYSSSLQHLIASMLHPDPLARPSADEILRHETVSVAMPTSSTQMARPASMAALLLSPRGTGGYTHSTPSPRMSAVHPSHMLLRNLRVDFGHRVSKEHDDTIYHVRLHNLASGRQWNVVKTFRDVRTLQDAMARQLKQGHPCHDVCPWLFAHVATTFPRSVSAARPWMHALRWTRKPPPETSHLKMFLSTSHGVFSRSLHPTNALTWPMRAVTLCPEAVALSGLSVDYPDNVHQESVESMASGQKKREDKRFHGAFTGGFSAGYFNTVGSKEGWTPSTFQSSRSQLQGSSVGGDAPKPRQQRIEDFMDEEDDPLLGRRLGLNAQFDPLAGDNASRYEFQAKQAATASIPGFIVDDFIQPSRSTIGTTLLGKMGWKPGQGVGPKVRKRKFTSRFTDALPRDQADSGDTIFVAPKHTLDISTMFPPPKLDKYGVGYDPALEEADDLDVYAMDSKDAFDRVLAKQPSRAMLMAPRDDDGDDEESAASQVCSDGSLVLTGFRLSTTRSKPPTVLVAHVDVPPNWVPTLQHLKLAPVRKQTTQSAADRGRALGELPPKPQAERQLLHSQFRAGMMAAISSRFQSSSASSATDEMGASLAPRMQMEPLARQTKPWMPDRLLCKRFRLPVPDAAVGDVPAKSTPNRRFEHDIMAHVPVGAGVVAHDPVDDHVLPDLPPLERPAMDLFQSVFDNPDDTEDDDSSSSSSSDEAAETTATPPALAPPRAPVGPARPETFHDTSKRKDVESPSERDDRYRKKKHKKDHRVKKDKKKHKKHHRT
ncbi:hypothetical protein DYB32_002003 [Aphanomyces invadans]|uniref:G-patch domain-containing protein n=1 Tax=Aphanomyces invadans TaxID=157072 RepID=A0A418B4E7_9STRA|nr:hypothetical protein DYB32_002003 [Aphanomyces invadans]